GNPLPRVCVSLAREPAGCRWYRSRPRIHRSIGPAAREWPNSPDDWRQPRNSRHESNEDEYQPAPVLLERLGTRRVAVLFAAWAGRLRQIACRFLRATP